VGNRPIADGCAIEREFLVATLHHGSHIALAANAGSVALVGTGAGRPPPIIVEILMP
jgi:hypothetical protein